MKKIKEQYQSRVHVCNPMRLLTVLILLFSFSVLSQKEKPKNYRRFDERLIHFGFMLGANTANFSLYQKPNAYETFGLKSLSTRSSAGGQVAINDSTCIGCATCANSCPYDNIRMVEARDSNGALIRDTATKAPIFKATKCDLCLDQLGGPACQRACPHDALERVDMQNLPDLGRWLNR